MTERYQRILNLRNRQWQSGAHREMLGIHYKTAGCPAVATLIKR